jgi:hypothetical protein
MTMKAHLSRQIFAVAFALGALTPSAAHAQFLSYGEDGGDDGSDAGDEGGDDMGTHGARVSRVRITPYIEAQQVAQAELSPGSDVLTYSVLAAGLDASLNGRNTQASASLRYERRFGWGKKTNDADVISGVARASFGIVPRTLSFEVGALASRMSVENNGSTVSGNDLSNSITQIYSVYAGPSLTTHAGDVAIDAHYRLGYTRVESPSSLMLAPGQPLVDVFDESVVHNAQVHAGTRPGTVLPVGLGVGAGWVREDVSNLDQRVDDKHARADITIPVSSDVALLGGIGYEHVEISSRDAVRDTLTGDPVIGPDGRYLTDKSAPRRIAFESDGLIWDAGVLWRPSRRTSLEAHVGRRYDSTSYYGSFAYAPSSKTSINVSVYDNITGFGGMVTNALSNLPTQFDALRNPLTGDIGGCVAAQGSLSSGQGACLNNALGSVRSSVFRSRGIMATAGYAGSRVQYGVGAGYDRRKFVAAPGTVLASANGVIDENYWLAGYLNGRIDANSSFGTNVWANWYQSGDALSGDVVAVGATAAYYRSIGNHLTATAAIGTESVNRELLEDIWTAQAMLGLRYSF